MAGPWIVRSEYEQRPAEDRLSGWREVAWWGKAVAGVGDGLRFPCESDGGCSGGWRADVGAAVCGVGEGEVTGVAAEEADGSGAAVAEGGHFC